MPNVSLRSIKVIQEVQINGKTKLVLNNLLLGSMTLLMIQQHMLHNNPYATLE